MASRARAEQLFAAMGARVADPLRDPKYESARVKLANAAVLPSRVWNDTGVWTSSTPARRTIGVGGRFADGRYRLDAMRSAPPPLQPADSRHVIHLTKLSEGDEFAWDTDVAYAIGSISARDVAAFVGALFASAEGRDEAAIRADYGAAIPRASAVLGLLFALDSIRTTHFPDRSTLAVFSARITPSVLEKRYPHFAGYMRRYAETAKVHWNILDRSGAAYLEMSLLEGRMLLRVRTLNGDIVPLAGGATPLPDSLTLAGDVTLKVRRFTVGFRGFRGDFNVVRTDHERGWGLVSRQEPHWQLPLITERLLRTPLKRPFQGSGATFRITVRDSAGAQTILHRRLHLEVQESAILRFIGWLGSIAISDYSGDAQREQYLWLNEFFMALVADIKGLSP